MYSHAGGGSGGYLEHVIKHAANQLFGFNLESIAYKTLRLGVKKIHFKEKILFEFLLLYWLRLVKNSTTGGTLVQAMKR